MSFKAEVIADSSGKWNSNALRFATFAEAKAYGDDLYCRWMAVTRMQVVECDDPVNYAWDADKGGLVCLDQKVAS